MNQLRTARRVRGGLTQNKREQKKNHSSLEANSADTRPPTLASHIFSESTFRYCTLNLARLKGDGNAAFSVCIVCDFRIAKFAESSRLRVNNELKVSRL
jgi:hypothetical protein